MKTTIKNKFRLLMTLMACLIFTSLKAQQDSVLYPIVIQFNSFGTGVPGDSALRCYIKSFKKKNKIKTITASNIGPMGREGEYWLCFSLKELSQKQSTLFIKGIKMVAEKPTSRGSTVFVENMALAKDELPQRRTISEVIL